MDTKQLTELRQRIRQEAAGLTFAEIDARRAEAARTGCRPDASDEVFETFEEWVALAFIMQPGSGNATYDPAKDPRSLTE